MLLVTLGGGFNLRKTARPCVFQAGAYLRESLGFLLASPGWWDLDSNSSHCLLSTFLGLLSFILMTTFQGKCYYLVL